MKALSILLSLCIVLCTSSAKAGDAKTSSQLSTKSKEQSYLLKLDQKEQTGTGPVREPPAGKVPVPPSPVRKSRPPEGGMYINKAWLYYRAARYEDAARMFQKALRFGRKASREAELGLAYCYLREGKPQQALPSFKKLVDQKYRLKDTLPALMNLYIQNGDYQNALAYINLFETGEKERWQTEVKKIRVEINITDAISKGDAKTLLLLTDENKEMIRDCSMPDLFYQAAEALSRGGEKKESVNLHLQVLSACQNEYELRTGIFYNLKTLLPLPQVDALLIKDMERDIPAGYKKKLLKIRVEMLQERLAHAGPAEIENISQEILSLQPDDASALSALGWEYDKRKQYQESLEIFQGLYSRYPREKSYAQGLVDALIALNRDDEAMRVTGQSAMSGEEMNRIKAQIAFKKADQAYKEKDYLHAELYLGEILASDPQNDGARRLLAWILYNQNNIQSALPLFLDLYHATKDPTAAEAVLLCYENSSQILKAVSFAREIAAGKDAGLQKIAGDYLLRKGMPVTAAGMYQEPDSCYFNAERPFTGISAYYSHKSGTSGLSKLDKIVYPVSFHYSPAEGSMLQFSLVTKKLSAGHISDSTSFPYAGSFYRHLQDGITQKHDIITSLWITTPTVRFEREGYDHYILQVGTTPLGGVVSPVPTLLGRIKRNNWSFTLHQTPVEESILSYTGLRDPYGHKKWGRVVKSGTEAEITFPLFSSCWLSFKGGYDYIWGENVWKNQKFEGTIAFGKTFTEPFGDVSAGVFLTGQHFERNTDFFTFGHGGYFSPDAFLMSGPTLGFETKPCRSYWFRGNVSLGYFYSNTENAPHYPLKETVSSALPDLNKEYQGRDFSGFGYSIQLESLKLITPYLAGGCIFNINKSPNYTEWMSGLQLTFYFGSRSVLLPKSDSVQ